MNTKIIGYKGFDKNFKCRDFQFKIGETFEHQGDAKLCESGFHFCENPLDVFNYYSPSNSVFAVVEADEVSDKKGDDSKRVSKKLFVKEELSLHSLADAGVKFILSKVDFKDASATNTGDRSAATNTGNGSAATNTGYCSAATNTGYYSAATNTGNYSAATNTGCEGAAGNSGKEGYAAALGINGKAKGALGCWLTLAEWAKKDGEWHRINIKTIKVDGKKIKSNVFYKLSRGKFIKA